MYGSYKDCLLMLFYVIIGIVLIYLLVTLLKVIFPFLFKTPTKNKNLDAIKQADKRFIKNN